MKPKVRLQRHHIMYAVSIAFGVILVWRGIWNLIDVYLLPQYPIVSNVISILVGLVVLYLPDHNVDELV